MRHTSDKITNEKFVTAYTETHACGIWIRCCCVATEDVKLLKKNLRACLQRIETLRSRFSAFPANRKRQEVTWLVSCCQVCSLRFTFIRLDHAPEVSDLPQGFLHSKLSQSHVWEEIRLVRTISLINYWTIFFIELNFEDDFSAKIEVNEWIAGFQCHAIQNRSK